MSAGSVSCMLLKEFCFAIPGLKDPCVSEVESTAPTVGLNGYGTWWCFSGPIQGPNQDIASGVRVHGSLEFHTQRYGGWVGQRRTRRGRER